MRRISIHPLCNEESRRAIVADKDIDFGMARMYATLCDDGPKPIRVFRNMSKARRWLGLD